MYNDNGTTTNMANKLAHVCMRPQAEACHHSEVVIDVEYISEVPIGSAVVLLLTTCDIGTSNVHHKQSSTFSRSISMISRKGLFSLVALT